MANGDNSGTWGTITNTNLGTLIEDAIAGLANVSITSAAQALTVQDGAADQARCAAFNLTTTTTAAFAAYVPPVTKLYIVKNSSIYTATVYASTVAGNTTAAGTGVAIPAGRTAIIRCDGTNIIDQLDYVSGNLTIGGNQTITGSQTVTTNQIVSGTLAVTGTSTFTGSAAFSGVPTAPTAASGTNTTQIATTAFVAAAATSSLASPAFTGTPTAPTPAPGTNTTQIATTAFVGTAVSSGIPSGMVMHFASSTAPTGWLECSGAAVSRTTYASLFSAIGTLYGVGDGSTTFNLPDLRGNFIRGWDNGRGIDTGRTIGSSQTATRIGVIGDSRTTQALSADTLGDTITNSITSYIMNSYQNTTTSGSYGVGARPINIAMLPCIKT
jgi:microcystin-dependent protein